MKKILLFIFVAVIVAFAIDGSTFRDIKKLLDNKTTPAVVISNISFAEDSWATVSSVSAAITAGANPEDFNYAVGDERDIELSTGEVITVLILGFNHDELSDGSGYAGISIGMKNLLATTYPMNASNINTGGWDQCLFRTQTIQTLLTELPSDLQGVIKLVNKPTTVGNLSTNIVQSQDKLWLFSEKEIDNNTVDAGYNAEGEQYEYYRTVKDGTVGADRIKNLSNGSGSANFWWLRSPFIGKNTFFRCITNTGVMSYDNAGDSVGICFGWCV